jgi:hypothetical protein
MKFKVVCISCGEECLMLETESQAAAARFYKKAQENQTCVRIRINGRLLSILDADRLAYRRASVGDKEWQARKSS